MYPTYIQNPSTSGYYNNDARARIKSRIDSCFVPMCPSTSVMFPNKLFLTGPSDPSLRILWFQAAKRDVHYAPKTTIQCCEDHFDLENDVENWIKYKMMGGPIYLKKGVLPHFFACQNRMLPVKPSSEELKRKRRQILESILNIPGKSDHNYSNDVVHYDHTYSRVKATTGIQSVGAATTVSQKDQPSTSNSGTGINETSTATDDTADDTFENNDYTPTSPDPPPDYGTPSRETVFSWQKSELIAADEDEPEPEVVPTLDLEGPADPSGVSLYEDPETVTCGTAPPGTTVEYRCKECGEAIEGFQFWCVQCVGRVVCGACDARGPHRTHYVLRVPAGKPQSQTQGVLATIREQLLNVNLVTLIEDEVDGVKVEVKDEPIEEPVPPAASPAPPAEPDPLACDPPAPPAAPRLPLPRLPPILRRAQRPRDVEIADYNQPFKRPRLLNYHTTEKRTIPSSQNSTNRPVAMKVTSEPTPTQLAVPIVLDDDEVYTEVEALDDDIEEVEYVERLEEGIDEEGIEDVERLEDEDIERLEDLEHNYDSDSEASEYIPEKRRTVRRDDDDSSDESDVENIATRGLSKRIESITGRSISKIVESVSGNVSNIENIAKRSMDRRKNLTEETLKLRGPEELMSKILPAKALIRVRPLSNLEVKKWTDTSK